MKEKQVFVRLSNYEQRFLVAVLNEFRNSLIDEDKATDDADDLLIKIIDSPLWKDRRKVI